MTSSSLTKPDAIFFDWDGTLVDSLPVILACYNKVLKQFGLPSMSEEEGKQRIRKSAREIFPEIFGDRSDEAFAAYYKAVEEMHLEKLAIFPDAHTFIEKLAAYGLTLGIVSNKRHTFLLKEISHLGWDKYLTTNIGAGEAAKDKPAPDLLLLALDKSGLSAQNQSIWYVGDTETDMMAAEAAGLTPVFIEHGLGTRQKCEEHGLHPYFVKDLSELIALVENFYKS